MKSIVQKKNNKKKASRVKKSLFVKKKEEDSHSGDDNIEKMILDNSEKDSEFMEELISSLMNLKIWKEMLVWMIMFW
jgi:hypothetical protein